MMSEWEREYQTNLIRSCERSIDCVDDMIQSMLMDATKPEHAAFQRMLLVERLNELRDEYRKRVPGLIPLRALVDKAT